MDINKDNIFICFEKAINNNDLVALGEIIGLGFDLNSIFGLIITLTQPRCSMNTLLFLEQNCVDLSPHIELIGFIMIKQNDLTGIKYCLENGADGNELFRESINNLHPKKELIEYFLQNGFKIPDMNNFEIFLLANRDISNNFIIIPLLIDYGFDIFPYINNFAEISINYGKIDIFKYLISIGLDVYHNDNELLMYAIEKCQADIVEYLLESGVNIREQDNSIFNFNKDDLDQLSKTDLSISAKGYLSIFKILIKYNIIIRDIENLFVSYVFLYNGEIDNELFIWFLDNGLQICNNKLLELIIKYERDDVAILCFKNGIILDITPGLCSLAVRKYDIELKKILEELGTDLNIWEFSHAFYLLGLNNHLRYST